jgi:hypothetical protein
LTLHFYITSLHDVNKHLAKSSVISWLFCALALTKSAAAMDLQNLFTPLEQICALDEAPFLTIMRSKLPPPK